jgi:hypothetical protein
MYRVKTLTNVRLHMGTWPTISLHQWNTTEDETGMIKTCVTSSTIEMHVFESKTGAKN